MNRCIIIFLSIVTLGMFGFLWWMFNLSATVPPSQKTDSRISSKNSWFSTWRPLSPIDIQSQIETAKTFGVSAGEESIEARLSIVAERINRNADAGTVEFLLERFAAIEQLTEPDGITADGMNHIKEYKIIAFVLSQITNPKAFDRIAEELHNGNADGKFVKKYPTLDRALTESLANSSSPKALLPLYYRRLSKVDWDDYYVQTNLEKLVSILERNCDQKCLDKMESIIIDGTTPVELSEIAVRIKSAATSSE